MEALVPVSPIRRLIEQWAIKHLDCRELIGARAAGCLLGNTGIIAHLVDLPRSYIKDIRSGRIQEMEFGKADKIVTGLSDFGGFGWFDGGELEAIYQSVDLGEAA